MIVSLQKVMEERYISTFFLNVKHNTRPFGAPKVWGLPFWSRLLQHILNSFIKHVLHICFWLNVEPPKQFLKI